jgi:hypothetical protein
LDESPGTVDVTNLVATLQSTFVNWATAYVVAQTIAIPYLSWIAMPFVNYIYKSLVGWLLGILSRSTVMMAFFMNTAIKKASQAQDYLDAVNAKNSLPNTVTQAQYKQYEQNEISAFNSLVSLTS